jgi:hypothetical protein
MDISIDYSRHCEFPDYRLACVRNYQEMLKAPSADRQEFSMMERIIRGLFINYNNESLKKRSNKMQFLSCLCHFFY